MGTMIKISRKSDFDPEYIQNELFYFSILSHKFHLDTTSFSEHKALDELYKGISDIKDEILEKLIGYINGKRIGALKIKNIPEYSNKASIELCNEISEFAYELYEWAGSKKYCDIENKAQELSGLANKTIYLLTLS